MTIKLKAENSVEINSEDAHIIIRTSDEAAAQRYVRMLFPDFEIKAQGDTKMIFTQSFRNGQEPVGTISQYHVDAKWTTNRRIDDDQVLAA